ncbi:RBBP9/YdeN family alpha/beta hydrolase [Flavobacterium hydatis]|uniref:Alpha/beta hydrolase n=1 Tax=Flavobacterium hydatis TaxID=991 RepID=A0A086AHD8_FLAHY|nr:alpha/beta hydrolase [Flavobacterium hydatis]KFF16102.1 alpha/beta hydrolase [Flavobacterium hydatis]OXA97639.1 alpha/beta hydrolase [Flavobacterium hydatis]
MEANLLILPGLGDSGEKHWQIYWLKKFKNATKLVQDNWDEPVLKDWLERLNEIISKIDKPTILVAHSLAVSLVMHWAKTNNNPHIIGALLVAPADVDSPIHTPDSIRNFSPIPTTKLQFPSIVVGSQNDEYATIERTAYFAQVWGSDFVDVGLRGHINSASDLEYWEEGQEILKQLIEKIDIKI